MAWIVGRGILGDEKAQEKGYNGLRKFWHKIGYALSFKWARKAK